MRPADIRPEWMPLLGPADTLELIGFGTGTDRRSGYREWIFVALHRTHGDWTHVYDVVLSPGRLGTEIRLIRVLPGDRRAEARAWAMAARGDDLCRRGGGGDRSLYGRGLVWCRPCLERMPEEVAEDPAAAHRAPPARVAAFKPPQPKTPRPQPLQHGR